jgi:hypothetical protein
MYGTLCSKNSNESLIHRTDHTGAMLYKSFKKRGSALKKKTAKSLCRFYDLNVPCMGVCFQLGFFWKKKTLLPPKKEQAWCMDRLWIMYCEPVRIVELVPACSRAATLIASYCMHIEISYHPALNPHTPVSYRVALSMLKQCCVCTREGTKPPTMFVSLSEVLILQQYVKWTGRGVERGGSERFTMEIWGSSLIFYSLPSSPPIESIVAYTHSVITGFMLSKIYSHQSDTGIKQLTYSSFVKYECHSLCALFLWMWLLLSSLSRDYINAASLMGILRTFTVTYTIRKQVSLLLLISWTE